MASSIDITKFYGIQRLTRANYRSWSCYMSAILEEENLLDVALGTATVPNKTTDKDAFAAHSKLLRKCRNKIILSLSEDLLDLVQDYEDPKDVWAKLKTTFQPQTRLSRLQAYRAFLMARLFPGEEMQVFVDRVRQLLHDAVKAGCECPSEETHCYVLLMGLPEEYSHIVTMTETLSDADYNARKIESLIVGEFRRREANTDASIATKQAADLLLSKRSPDKRTSKQRSPRRRRREDKRCYICNSSEHFARNCPKRNHSTSSSKEKTKSTSHTQKTTMVLTSELRGALLNGGWIVDSGASAHMTPDRTTFSTYRCKVHTPASPMTTSALF